MHSDPDNADIVSGERLTPGDSELIGSSIGGRYTVLQRLGSGGMADVYEVEHRELGRRFALKMLRGEAARDSALRGRFEREARTVAKLNSEHIVAILDCGTTPRGEAFFVMERLQGQDLRHLLESEGALPARRAVEIASHVCRALDVAHAAGVVHRDLKPENLFLVQSSSGAEVCKVLDFGVAKLTGENPTLPGTLLGTARYMAPEQIRDGRNVGPATDVFALGVILFECLSGVPPFNGDTLERVLFKIVSEPAPSLAELRPELPSSLVRLVERMLDKEPSARPQSAREVQRELERGVPRAQDDGTLLVTSSSVGSHSPRGDSRGRLGLVFLLGVGLGAALMAAWPTTPRAVGPVAATSSQRAALPAASLEPAPTEPDAARSSAPPPSPVATPPRTPPRVAAPAPSSAPAAADDKPPLFFPSER